MPEPLVCEDSNLQRLLDTVHGQPGAEILYQDRVRRGGVFGFFAREVHRVAYRLPTEGEDAGTVAADPLDADPIAVGVMPAAMVATGPISTAPISTGPISTGPVSTGPVSTEPADGLPRLDDLLASVEAAESAGQHAVAPASSAGQPPRHDFAELLRTLTEDEPAEADPGITEPVSLRPAPAAAVRQPASRTNVTAFGRPDARARLEMLMQLRQVGVPVSVNPRADTHSLYEALENILEELPAPAVPPRGAGQVLAVVGESGPALQAAHTCAAMLRIPRDSIGIAGLPEHSSEGRNLRDYPVISGLQEALRLRTELSRADLPAIVVIATDATESG
ncbi:MAG: hypothetical protein QOE53_2688, partial [Pseudonocardiales bacterium]|nr:hypothetical protein [Pseudonocardiales bacterium]